MAWYGDWPKESYIIIVCLLHYTCIIVSDVLPFCSLLLCPIFHKCSRTRLQLVVVSTRRISKNTLAEFGNRRLSLIAVFRVSGHETDGGCWSGRKTSASLIPMLVCKPTDK